VREYYDDDLSVNGEWRIIRHNAMEACERTLHIDPRYGIFLLRLLDTRPVATADTETDLLNWLGRDVNAPLTHPDFPLVAHGKDNALEYACKDLDHQFTKPAHRADQAAFAHTMKAPAPSLSLGGV
jgi:hypothetical protein